MVLITCRETLSPDWGEGRSQGSFPSWPWLQPPPPPLYSKRIPSREGAQRLNPCSTPPSPFRPTAHLAQWHHHLCLTPNIYSFPGKQSHETRRKNRRNPSFPFCVGGQYFLAASPSQKWLSWLRPSLFPIQQPFKSSLKSHPCSKFARDRWSKGSTASSLTICHACVEEKQPQDLKAADSAQQGKRIQLSPLTPKPWPSPGGGPRNSLQSRGPFSGSRTNTKKRVIAWCFWFSSPLSEPWEM